MINARNNINNVFTEKIIVNDILDNLEYYKDKSLIKFLRKINPEDDEFYNYENEVIQEFRKKTNILEKRNIHVEDCLKSME